MKATLKTLIAAAALTVGTFGMSSIAHAALVTPCVGAGYDISGKISGAYDCGIDGTETQDFVGGPNPANYTVNLENYFGRNDWAFGGKIGVDTNYNGSGSGQSGTYDFSAAGLLGTVMAVFKDGSGTTLIAYLISTASGTWDTPFLTPPFSQPQGNPKDVSHISIYSSASNPPPGCDPLVEICGPGVNVVPIPAGLPLLLTALGTVGIISRRRKG